MLNSFKSEGLLAKMEERKNRNPIDNICDSKTRGYTYRFGIVCGLFILLLIGELCSKTIFHSMFSVRGLRKRKPQICQKKTHVAFIKIHKASSTTITSILQRYGVSNSLTFALPAETNWWISLSESINPRNVLPIEKGKTYDILCQHVVYERQAFRRMLPRDTFIMASVREPFQRFMSAFIFFKEYKHSVLSKSPANISAKDPVELMRRYLLNPRKYEPRLFKSRSIALNRMSLSFGIPAEKYLNKSFVDKYIRKLDHDVSLVLVTELLDESLVLLRRKLCWSMKDIFYQRRYRGPPKPKIPDNLRIFHKKLAPAEYQLYVHFYKKLKHEISAQGTSFLDETKLFKLNLQKVRFFCRGRNYTGNEVIAFPTTRFYKKFTFTRSECKLLKMHEVTFVKLLKKRQADKYLLIKPEKSIFI